MFSSNHIFSILTKKNSKNSEFCVKNSFPIVLAGELLVVRSGGGQPIVVTVVVGGPVAAVALDGVTVAVDRVLDVVGALLAPGPAPVASEAHQHEHQH